MSNNVADFKKLVEDLIDSGILVAKEKEAEYCEKYGLELIRNDNGSVFIGSTRLVDDEKYSSMYLEFRGGSLLDPKEKGGLAHFLEHLFFTPELNDRLAADFSTGNAFTSSRQICYKYRGVTNAEFPDFSFYSTLDLYLQTLMKYPALQDAGFFRNVNRTIHSEIDQEEGDFFIQVEKELNNYICDEKNFRNINVLGTQSSLDKINAKDIEKFLKDNITSDNLVISLFTTGYKNDYELTRKES